MIKALELDDTLAEAHSAFAMAALWYDLDVRAALRAFERAIELSPNEAWAQGWCGAALALLGRDAAALAAAKRARELDPLSPIINALAGLVIYWAHRYEEARVTCQEASKIGPDHPAVVSVYGTICMGMARYEDAIAPFKTAVDLSGRGAPYLGALGAALGAAGCHTEARQVMDELVGRSKEEHEQRVKQPDGDQLHVQRYVAPVHLAWVHLGLGEIDLAAELYEQACEEGNVSFWNPTDPFFEEIRSHPSFRKFCERAGYPH